MLGKLLFLITILFLASCRDEVKGFVSAEDLIPRDSMVLILKDMTLLESHVQLKYAQVNRYHKTMTKSGGLILKKYRVSPKRYEESMNYYGSHQTEMQSIYSQVLDSLNRMSNQIEVNDTIQKTTEKQNNSPFGIIKKPIIK